MLKIYLDLSMIFMVEPGEPALAATKHIEQTHIDIMITCTK